MAIFFPRLLFLFINGSLGSVGKANGVPPKQCSGASYSTVWLVGLNVSVLRPTSVGGTQDTSRAKPSGAWKAVLWGPHVMPGLELVSCV